MGEAKRSFQDCWIVLAGDFNQWGVDVILEEHPDLTVVSTGPTRGDRTIDLCLTNFNRSIAESGTLEPLESEMGQASDHRMVFFSARSPKALTKKIRYSYRYFSRKGSNDFEQWLKTCCWDPVYSARTSSLKVKAFDEILEVGMNKFFPWKTTVRLESDPPWVNDKIRRLQAKKRKVYCREGRSDLWKKLKKKAVKIIRKRAKVYLQTQKDVMLAPDAVRNFYKHVKSYGSKEKPPQFDVRTLYEGCTDSEVADKLATHFGSITNGFQGLRDDQVPSTWSSPIPALTAQDITKRLLSFRKPKSMVPGDIFPALVNPSVKELVPPLQNIFNCISDTGTWPEDWKTEYVTAIPKKTHPASPDDLRNISCTRLFSKVYESFILQWLTQQVGIRNNQFGGMRGSGTEHFLVHLWQKILEGLEDQRAAIALTSIDYSKAFSRLSFPHCIDSLAKKGASSELLRIVGSFLSGRKMKVRVGNETSEGQDVMGGVPQGSLLGVFLFNVAIDTFELNSDDVKPYKVNGGDPDHFEENETIPWADTDVEPPDENMTERKLAKWKIELLEVIKYIDDNLLVEKANFETVEEVDGVRRKELVRMQNLFRRIVTAAEDQGMLVNPTKTQLTIISDASYEAEAFFTDSNGCLVESQEGIKLLGFHFSSKPNMDRQIAVIKKKFRTRLWMLRHLWHVGFNCGELLKVYKSVILPVHDYCSTVWNFSITKTQERELERLQSLALKTIYGFEHSYRSLLEMTGLSTLKVRRDRRSDAFAQSCSGGRFEDWFPTTLPNRSTRSDAKYVESFARTERLRNSPLFAMRRRLNQAATFTSTTT